ncbi:MAG: hypothetical protein ACD_72C00069G0003 [uncultured bacterium]|nr:MAG: hypothetical protein ACD_72C00069G0003 [uncultured bacterium]
MLFKILKRILFFVILNALVLMNINWHTFFSNYANLLNFPLLFFLTLTIINPKQTHYFGAIYTFILSDLFFSAPFGLYSLSQILALLFINWLLLNVFTNRSLAIVFLNGFLVIMTCRLIYIFLLFLNSTIKNQPIFDWIFTIKIFLIEALVNAVALGVIYFVSLIFVKRLHPEYISIR